MPKRGQAALLLRAVAALRPSHLYPLFPSPASPSLPRPAPVVQRLIRTGRTGHWLNHSKEHCLVGIKGAPPINRNVDCDVVVAEVGGRKGGWVCVWTGVGKCCGGGKWWRRWAHV